MTDFRTFVRDVPDFPSPGILFRDVTPLLASPEAFAAAARAMADPFRGERPEKVLGIEARGFLFGTALARELNVGLVPARKAGKLPRATESVSYGLEYGKDRLEIHADAFRKGERVLIVDDVLATGAPRRPRPIWPSGWERTSSVFRSSSSSAPSEAERGSAAGWPTPC